MSVLAWSDRVVLRFLPTALVGLLLLTGCSVPGFGPDAEDAADTLARGLTEGSLAGVRFTGDDDEARASYVAVTKGLDDPAGERRPGLDRRRHRERRTELALGRRGRDVELREQRAPAGGRHLRWCRVVGAVVACGGRALVEGRRTADDDRSQGQARRHPGSRRRHLGHVAPGAPRRARQDWFVRSAERDLRHPAGEPRRRGRREVSSSRSGHPGPRRSCRRSSSVATTCPTLCSRECPTSPVPGPSPTGSRWLRRRSSLPRSWARSAPRPPRSSRTARVGCGPATTWGSPGCSAGTTSGSAALAGNRSSRSTRRVSVVSCSPSNRWQVRCCAPRSSRSCRRALSRCWPTSARPVPWSRSGPRPVTCSSVASGPGSKGYNTATYARAAPGSTFKVVSALALLRAGLSPSSTVPCTPTTVVDGKQFKNYSDYPSSGLGRIDLEIGPGQLLQHRVRLPARTSSGPTPSPRPRRRSGLGVDHDTGFPTYFGEVGRAGSETQARPA